MNAPSNLRGQYFEPLGAKSAGCALLGRGQRRRNRQVIPRMEGNGLTHDPQIPIELLELTAHPVQAPQERNVITRVAVGIEVARERGLYDLCLGDAVTLGGGLQSAGDILGEMSTDLGSHGCASLDRMEDLPWWSRE